MRWLRHLHLAKRRFVYSHSWVCSFKGPHIKIQKKRRTNVGKISQMLLPNISLQIFYVLPRILGEMIQPPTNGWKPQPPTTMKSARMKTMWRKRAVFKLWCSGWVESWKLFFFFEGLESIQKIMSGRPYIYIYDCIWLMLGCFQFHGSLEDLGVDD